MLTIKSFLGFRINASKRLLKTEAVLKAESHYVRNVAWKTLKGWLTYVLEKKQKEEENQVLIETIEKIQSKTLLERSMAMWKLFTEESTGFLSNVKIIMRESSKRRVLKSWKQHAQTKRYEREVLSKFERYQNLKYKSGYFQR